jgi:hypothetical protein
VYAAIITGHGNQAHRWQRDIALPSEREKPMSDNVIDATTRFAAQPAEAMKVPRHLIMRPRQRIGPKIGSNDNKPPPPALL